jgi:hypothetical protein
VWKKRSESKQWQVEREKIITHEPDGAAAAAVVGERERERYESKFSRSLLFLYVKCIKQMKFHIYTAIASACSVQNVPYCHDIENSTNVFEHPPPAPSS